MVVIRSPLPLSLPKIPSSLTSCFTTRSPFARFISTLKPPTPVPQEEGVYASPVQSVSAWRKQAAAEKSAGIEAPARVLVSLFECDVCGIHIGPGYDQQELFLCPVRNKVITKNKPIRYDAALLLCCGDCARHSRQLLPEWLRVVQPSFWETTMLLCDDPQEVRLANRNSLFEMKRIYAAIRQVLLESARLFFLVSAMIYSFSVSLFFKTQEMLSQVKEQALPVPIAREQGEPALSRIAHPHPRPNRYPLASYLSTLTPHQHHQRSITL